MNDPLPAPIASNTFERIKRVNAAGHEFWSARELARVLGYTHFPNFTPVITKAREACANSGHTVSGHCVDINEMVSIGSGAQRTIKDWALSRYACYLVIQNADPIKPLVALGQSYFAVQTRRQELADDEALPPDSTRRFEDATAGAVSFAVLAHRTSKLQSHSHESSCLEPQGHCLDGCLSAIELLPLRRTQSLTETLYEKSHCLS